MNNHLGINTTLRGDKYVYTIEKVLGQGSFGVTYLASTRIKVPGPLGELETTLRVCIKEFFMSDFSSRSADGTVTSSSSDGSLNRKYGEKFRKEAINLSHLHHPNIVKVLEVFDANNTHYYVMEYVAGKSLDEYIKQQGALRETDALSCVKILAEALGYMHAEKMLHLDLKPKNVMRRANDGQLFLIDFGLSKQYNEKGEAESSTTIGLGTKGYAPLEQSNELDTKTFPVTIDIYALGATLFKLLTGSTPPAASDVMNEGLPVDKLRSKGVSDATISVVEKMMQPAKRLRPQSMAEVVSLIELEEEGTLVEEVSPKPQPQPTPKPEPQPEPDSSVDPISAPSPKSPWLKYGAIAAVAVIVVALIAYFANTKGDPVTTEQEETIAADLATVEVNVPDVKNVTDKEFTDASGNAFKFTGSVDADGKPENGKAIYDDGRTYQGSMSNLQPSGSGLMIQANGDKFVGDFKNGKYVKGTYTSKSDGYYYAGSFKDGQPYNGTWYTPDGMEDAKVVNGK